MSRALPTLREGEYLLPQRNHITPSNINIWRGGRDPDEYFTRGQLFRLRERGLDPDLVSVLICRSKASRNEMTWGGSRTPVFVIPCPLLRTDLKKGKHVVIAPYGCLAWAPDHGWVRNNPFEKTPIA